MPPRFIIAGRVNGRGPRIVGGGAVVIPPLEQSHVLDFDGVNDYVTYGDNYGREWQTSAHSWVFWIKPSASTGGVRGIIAKSNVGGGTLGLLIQQNNLDLKIGFLASGGAASKSAVVTNGLDRTNLWTQLVISYNGSGFTTGLQVYKNGVAQSVSVTADNSGTTDVAGYVTIFGKNHASSSQRFVGRLGEVALFSSALTPTQATEAYNAGVPMNLAYHSAAASLDWWIDPSNSTYPTVSNVSGYGAASGTMTSMAADDLASEEISV